MLNSIFTALDIGLHTLGAFDVLGHLGHEGGTMD